MIKPGGNEAGETMLEQSHGYEKSANYSMTQETEVAHVIC